MNPEALKRLKSNPLARIAQPPPAPRPRKRLLRRVPVLLLILFLCLGLAAAAGWSAVQNPALASMIASGFAAPTQPAQAPPPQQFWARAALPKPVNTPVPTEAPAIEVLPEAAPPTEQLPPEEAVPLISAVIVEESQSGYSPEAPAPPAYAGSKYILVDISEQHLYAYENGALVYSFIASTGMNSATAIGSFAVQSKIPSAYGSTWDIWMPNWLGIYWSGGLENGIHALPILPNGGILWEGFLGRPISYGCVVLGTYESALLYDWAEYGTPVDIQW